MSKSSKAKKRINKMIRAELSILGEDNMMIEELRSRNDFNIYCNNRINYYNKLMGNEKLLKYYKTNIIPQLLLKDVFASNINNMNDILTKSNIDKKTITNLFKKVQKENFNG